MLKLFAGSANSGLSQEVAGILGIRLSGAEVLRFGNSEVKVRIQEDVKRDTCIVIQPTANPTDTNLIELLFFCDALRRQEAKKVIGFIPYFGYARQDIQHRVGECVSANVVIRFIESIGFGKIYTIDIHDEATEGVFSIPFKNLTSLKILATELKNYLPSISKLPSDVAIVSPDQGGVERARKFGNFLFGDSKLRNFSLTVIEKKRNLDEIHKSTALNLYGSVKGKVAVLVDDIVTSGGTLLNAAELCLARGASHVLAVIVHHDFSRGAPAKIQASKIARFFTTNTINLLEEQKFEKLHEVSVAPLIASEFITLKK